MSLQNWVDVAAALFVAFNKLSVFLSFLSFQPDTLMAASVLCRRAPRLCSLSTLRKDSTQAQHASVKLTDEAEDQEVRRGGLQHNVAPPHDAYRLSYNPSSYHSVSNFGTLRSHGDRDGEDECFSTLVPSFWQQGNRYSVSCSRRLSSTKNTLLDLAFNKQSHREVRPMPLKHIPADVKVDTRAFLKCRPEYASMTLDLTLRPHQIEWDEAMVLLQKVTVLRGRIKPTDVTQFLADLRYLHPERISLLRSDQRFVMLLRYSVEHLRLFTTPQLLEVLQSLAWLELPASHTILGLFEAELCCRADQMSFHQLLLAADLWRCIKRQVPEFLEHLYQLVRMCSLKIGIPELVHLLYIVGESRSCPRDLIHPLEQLLLHNLHQLQPEEVGTVCLALFKSRTSLSEGAVTQVVDKALWHVEEISDFALVNVMKFLRFNYLYHQAWLDAMAEEVPRRAHRMGVQGLMHVALACSALHCRNEEIFLAIAERVPLSVSHCRSKDSCKLLWAFGTLGFALDQSPWFYPSLMDALRQRKVEFQQYPQHLLTGLLGLAFVSQFPEDLLALALSPEFVKLALKSTKLELKKDLFTLDGAVALELPQWTGPRLSPELRQEVAEMLWKFAQSDVCQKPEVLEAESALQDLLGGEKFVRKRMILPHTRSIDLEVHLDSKGQPVPVELESEKAASSPESSPSQPLSHHDWGRMNVGVTITDELLAQLKDTKSTAVASAPSAPAKRLLERIEPDEGSSLFETGLVLTSDITDALIRPSRSPPQPRGPKGIERLAIQVTSRNQYCYHSKQLMGLHAMKRRQLKQAGYKVVELNYLEWLPLLRRSRTEKLAYLHCKVYSSL